MPPNIWTIGKNPCTTNPTVPSEVSDATVSKANQFWTVFTLVNPTGCKLGGFSTNYDVMVSYRDGGSNVGTFNDSKLMTVSYSQTLGYWTAGTNTPLGQTLTSGVNYNIDFIPQSCHQSTAGGTPMSPTAGGWKARHYLTSSGSISAGPYWIGNDSSSGNSTNWMDEGTSIFFSGGVITPCTQSGNLIGKGFPLFLYTFPRVWTFTIAHLTLGGTDYGGTYVLEPGCFTCRGGAGCPPGSYGVGGFTGTWPCTAYWYSTCWQYDLTPNPGYRIIASNSLCEIFQFNSGGGQIGTPFTWGTTVTPNPINLWSSSNTYTGAGGTGTSTSCTAGFSSM